MDTSGVYVETTIGLKEETLLLLHGGGVAGWMWRLLLEQLETDYSFLVPDLPGHDHSANLPYRSHQQTVNTLISLLEGYEGSPVTVIGFSLGAQLAILLASQRPDLVERVGIISAQAKPAKWPAAALATLRMAAPLAKNEHFARAQAKELFIPSALFPSYLRTSRSLSLETLLASVGENIRFSIPESWAEFPGDSLVLVGEAERPMMRTSANLLAGSQSGREAEIVADCGHGIPLQRPGWLAQRLQAWLP